MRLTDVAIRKAKPRDRAYKLTDGRGLTLLVQPSGAKWWRLRYRFNGVEKMLSLGVYPDVSLVEARERHASARRSLAANIDPSAERHAARRTAEHTFGFVARSWLRSLEDAVAADRRSTKTLYKAKWMLDTFVLPTLGTRPIGEITPTELLAVLKVIEARGLHETARRTKQRCGQVFRHAIGLGIPCRDLTPDLRGLLEPPTVRHHPSLTNPRDVGRLLRAIDAYVGRETTKLALQLAPLVFVRPSELRHAEWTEIDFEAAEWRLPASKMKMRVQHVVPLSTQAIAVLKAAHAINGDNRYVFPKQTDPTHPMSGETINQALRAMGFSNEQMTAHGFRSMASTLLNERGYRPDAIERQLAHGDPDGVRGAYNYAEYLPERREMMQGWADYLHELKTKARPEQGASRRTATSQKGAKSEPRSRRPARIVRTGSA
jgi:integrase